MVIERTPSLGFLEFLCLSKILLSNQQYNYGEFLTPLIITFLTSFTIVSNRFVGGTISSSDTSSLYDYYSISIMSIYPT